MAHEYDNAFRTMENDCPKLLIPLVNEVFKTNYSLESPIELYPNEQMITSPEDKQMIRITDSNFVIIGSSEDRYHIECESNPDSNELQVRIYQYDMQVALYGHTFIEDITVDETTNARSCREGFEVSKTASNKCVKDVDKVYVVNMVWTYENDMQSLL